MIIAFETKSTPILEGYLKNFSEPSNPFMMLIHNLAFTEKKITRIEDIVVIEQQSFIHIIAKYAMLTSASMFIIGMILGQQILMSVGALIIVLSMFLVSRVALKLLIISKIKLLGHKEPIKSVEDGLLISKLLYERENGTARSL